MAMDLESVADLDPKNATIVGNRVSAEMEISVDRLSSPDAAAPA